MTISPLALTAKRVIDAQWRQGSNYDLSSQAAFALESAQLLQSPETAADAERVRGQLAQEEQAYERLRVALESAKRGRRELQARVAELEAQREALAERLRAGQRWERGRNPELVSENFVSQSELRSIFGIPLAPPWADGISRRIAPTQALREDEPAEAPALTVFRASHESIVMGHYTSREAAREHCQTLMRRESPIATLEWRPDGEWREDDDGEPGPDEAEELYAYGSHESSTWDPTGYVVTPVEVASEYDEEADE